MSAISSGIPLLRVGAGLFRPLYALFIVLPMLLGDAGAAAPPPAPGAAPVILCFGDSLTAGFGVEAGASYPDLLAKRLRAEGLPHRVVNAGVSGDTTAGALRRLDWVLRAKPSLAVVTLGANDGLRGLDIDAMRDNLAGIIRRLQDAGVRVVLGGMRIPPNYGAPYTERFAAVYPQLARETGVALIPFFLEGVAGHPQLNQGDGIHPNAPGYRVVLENVWRVLRPLIEAAP